MARYVIDGPTLVHVVRFGVAVDAAHQLVAPNVIRSHALDLLLGAVRRDEVTDAEALLLHEQMTSVRIRVLGDRVSRRTAWQIARTKGWDSIRAAEYLAVTHLQADALVTVDPELAAAAADTVPVAPLAALEG